MRHKEQKAGKVGEGGRLLHTMNSAGAFMVDLKERNIVLCFLMNSF